MTHHIQPVHIIPYETRSLCYIIQYIEIIILCYNLGYVAIGARVGSDFDETMYVLYNIVVVRHCKHMYIHCSIQQNIHTL